MHRKFVRALAMALVAAFVMSAGAFAADKAPAKKAAGQMINGTVASIDMQKVMVTLKTTDGNSMQLKATASQLKTLHVGDHVKAEVVSGRAKTIHKQMNKDMKG
jgi:ribosomal protein S1